ncbi:MAG: polymer-forming cytoskeletal protein [Rhodospirillales bacterium]|nr:polymer-forming cytoskeletal protein [Rhodospirillales bacterium]MBI2978981.1 polymer-forming cytoskeletal protein [Rhodospirillales bacterium]
MFSKSSKSSSSHVESRSVVKSTPPSIISADLRIVGDLSSDGEIQVDGAVDGDIRTKSLLIGETAHIKGEIVAESVNVHGTVNGQIKSKAVNLAKTAHVVGDILHEDLAIETGAFLEGHCKRLPEKPDAADSRINVVGGEAGNRIADRLRGASAGPSKGAAAAVGIREGDKKAFASS